MCTVLSAKIFWVIPQKPEPATDIRIYMTYHLDMRYVCYMDLYIY